MKKKKSSCVVGFGFEASVIKLQMAINYQTTAIECHVNFFERIK